MGKGKKGEWGEAPNAVGKRRVVRKNGLLYLMKQGSDGFSGEGGGNIRTKRSRGEWKVVWALSLFAGEEKVGGGGIE